MWNLRNKQKWAKEKKKERDKSRNRLLIIRNKLMVTRGDRGWEERWNRWVHQNLKIKNFWSSEIEQNEDKPQPGRNVLNIYLRERTFSRIDNILIKLNTMYPIKKWVWGHQGGSVGWASDSWFWLGLWPQACGIEPGSGSMLSGESAWDSFSASPSSSPSTALTHSLSCSLSKINKSLKKGKE